MPLNFEREQKEQLTILMKKQSMVIDKSGG